MPIQHVYELFALDGQEFITEAYRNLLKREPDEHGMAYYLGRLAAGYGKASIIMNLAESKEARPHDEIKGLRKLVADENRAGFWFLGRFSSRSRIEQNLRSSLVGLANIEQRLRMIYDVMQNQSQLLGGLSQKISDLQNVATEQSRFPIEVKQLSEETVRQIFHEVLDRENELQQSYNVAIQEANVSTAINDHVPFAPTNKTATLSTNDILKRIHCELAESNLDPSPVDSYIPSIKYIAYAIYNDRPRCDKVAIIATVSPSGEVGGAERFYVGLRDALRDYGVDAHIVSVVSDESNFTSILESYLRFYQLDLSAYDGVISTKAPAYVVRHPNHVCYLQHTMRVFYDMFEVEFPDADEMLHEQRRLIQQIDTAALGDPRIRGRYVIGHEVQQRLRNFNGIDADVLYQSSTLKGFRTGEYRYIFMPGRLHRWKRADLVILAMRDVRAPIEMLIAGTGEDEAALRSLADGDPRIKFLGRVSDEELLVLYSNALAIPFVPYREDFGLVAIEAFNSGKPVITCEDSGEPARMVREFNAGIVCSADPAAIASAIDALSLNHELARAYGLRGRQRVREIKWDHVATTLLGSLGIKTARRSQ
jgi:glycosyltransferase involved in cell wall biosynthesis